MDGIRDADTAGFGEALEAGGDVDAVAVDLLAVDHHVAEVHADAKLHPALGWQIRVLGLERGLDLHGAFDRIHDAGELGKYAVAGGIDEASMMLLDERIDQLAMGRQGAESRFHVLPHEAAAAEDVGTAYGGELTFHHPPPGVTDNRASTVREPLSRLTVETPPLSRTKDRLALRY